MSPYKLDRTTFKMHHTKDAENNYEYWKTKSYAERLRAAHYLNSVAYNFPFNDPPKIDKTFFKMRSRK